MEIRQNNPQRFDFLDIMIGYFYGWDMAKPSRSIQAGTDLPRSFAVIEAASYHQAIRTMRDAFADPEIHLVVWTNAADLVNDRMRMEIENFTARRANFERISHMQQPDNVLDKILHRHDTTEMRLKRHFNRVALSAELARKHLDTWRDDSRSFITALQEELEPYSLRKMLRSLPINKKEFIHYDGVSTPDHLVILRNLSGDPTEYYDPADHLGERLVRVGKWTQERRNYVRENATRWMAGPLAVAFHSGKILHSAPSIQNEPLAAGQFRVNEFFLLKGCRNTLACHRPV